MKIHYIALILAVIVAIAACARVPEGGQAATTIPDQHNSQTALDWQGSYAGNLPGADVSAIRATVVLRSNGEYIQTLQYADRSGLFRETGKFHWLAGGNVVVLRGPNGGGSRFQVQENALLPLTQEDQPLSVGNQQWPLHKVGDFASTQELYQSFRWQLQSLPANHMEVHSASKAPYLVFSPATQHLSGWDGCNRIAGAYTVGNDQHLHFGPIISTRMACAGVTIDRPFAIVLEHTAAFRTEKEHLLLLGGDGAVLARFRALSQPEPH